jgi:hypothetical protein
MRALRTLTLVLVALATPLSRGGAQTCQGSAAFQDGRAVARVDDKFNSIVNDVGASLAYGIPRSFYGGISIDRSTPAGSGLPTTGFGAGLGYQVRLSDTPFQLCPSVLWHYAAVDGVRTTTFGLGGSLGYRVGISDWFALVPAAGLSWMSAKTTGGVTGASGLAPGSSETQTGTDVFMTLGLVFNRALTINPGVIVPSQSRAKSIYTIGVSINWANAVSR